ncbi:unnamed protein product, partial [Prorocentrum cordatum]
MAATGRGGRRPPRPDRRQLDSDDDHCRAAERPPRLRWGGAGWSAWPRWRPERSRRRRRLWRERVGLTTLPAAARASDKTGWKQDIPRALTSLQRLDWAAIRTVGKERSGAESVRSLLLTRYDEVLEGTSPAGGKIGLNVNGCRITAVSDPNLGFLEED